MANKCLKTYKTELKTSNCGFDHDPIDSMVRSQWQLRTKSFFYLAYRWIVAAFFIAVFIIAIHSHLQKSTFSIFFVYLTRWGLTLNMIVGVYGAILVTFWHFHSDFQDKISRSNEMPTKFKIYWALHNIALVISFCITIIYWSFLHKKKSTVSVANILSHAMNSVIMFIDVLIVSYPLRLYHVIQPIAFAAIYGVFSYIYYLCGGVNISGHHYVYHVLDWSQPRKAMTTVIGTLILAFLVHMTLFWIYKLRVFIQRRLIANEMSLPMHVTEHQANETLDSQM